LQDARIDPCAALGLAEGDAHVIRNAGGRASDDAIRSLVISHKLLGTKEWFVIHHTDCGMEYFKSSQLAELLKTSLSTANIVPDEAAPKGVKFENVLSEGGASTDIDFLHIDNQDESVKEDVAKIAQHPLVASGIPVHGYMYDCKTGKINHIVSAVTRE
jgi:carbonic anhydrase